MQIHELNPFQGTLGSEAFLVVDNGEDTGKISVERLTEPINERIDDIITSPAPTEQEIIDARRGWNEVVYGSLGTAIRSQVKQILAQFYKFNTYDLLGVYGTPISRTRNGVTFTWDDAGQVCEVSGEAVGGDAYAGIYTQTGAWQGIFERGVTYTIGYETTDPNVKLRIAIWEGIETTPSYYYFDEDGHFGIPPEAAKISIDLWVASGDTVSAVVKNVYMLRTYTAKEVTATIRDAMIGADRHMYNSLGDAIREQLNGKVDKVTGKVLSTNDFTDADKTKLDDVEAGAEVNAIEAIKLDGAELTPDANRAVNIPVDETLTGEGVPADAKIVGEKLENKANIDGYYETFTSGQTEQLIATEAITDTEPYIYRKTGGPNDVGDRVYDTLVGGSVVWNQLVDSGTTEVTVPNGHKYYANINGTKSIGASTGTTISINDSTEDNVIDLTAALTPAIADYVYSLETATAGAGVAWFKKYFPKEYFACCEPHFEHVQTSAKETVGFNQWDEEWERGAINATTGGNLSSNNHIRSKNYTACFPNTAYYFKAPVNASPQLNVFYYDGNKNFISSSTVTNTYNTTPANCYYMRIHSGNPVAPVTTYNHDICINIHGDRDGEYEAYRKRTYLIEPKVLRGVLKLDSANRLYLDGDVMRHDGSGEQRYSEYTFTGNETWTFFDAGEKNTFNCVISGAKSGGNGLMAGKYALSNASVISLQDDKTFIFFTGSGGTRISVYDSAYSDVDAFKASMAGVKLLYERKTPEPFTVEPFQSPMVVDPLGTEEFIDYGVEQGDRDVAIPVGHKSEYPPDLRGKLQHLPGLSSSGDGRYVVVQTGTQMSLTPDTSLGLIAALEARVAALEGGNG